MAAEPNQMALATADAAGSPSVRMVLLKGYDARGFIFYTNYDSRKAAELANGRAALSMYWEPLQRSVRALVSRNSGSCNMEAAHQLQGTATPVCHLAWSVVQHPGSWRIQAVRSANHPPSTVCCWLCAIWWDLLLYTTCPNGVL